LIDRDLSLMDKLEGLDRLGTASFAHVVTHFEVELETISDGQLADLIEADGRRRLQRREPIGLERYLSVIPNLRQRPDPLDAAVDMTLRSHARAGQPTEEAVHDLVAMHPELERPIREAAALNNALWSTHRVQRHLAESTPPRALPADFGPLIESGERRYELKDLLGEGAFGQVYLAVDRQLSDEGHAALVSIKVLPGYDRSAWARQRLVDEATKARRIAHPNVVSVLDRGVSDENEDFIVYEFVDGGELGRWYKREGGHAGARAIASMVSQIARGVHAAHMAGLVHCDLKPNNVILTAAGVPKVSDFGIAIRANEPAARAGATTTEQEPLGNLAFMSPEQHRMEPGATTIPTDVYALGGMLYWLLTGTLPNGSNVEEIRRTHDRRTGRPEPPRLPLTGGTDRDLEAIVRRAMAIAPEDRHSSAAVLADELDAWLRLEPIRWTRPTPLRLLHLWIRRKPALAAVTAVTILLAIGGGFAVERAVLHRNRREQASEMAVRFVSMIKEAQNAELVSELLPQIWYVEWLFGPTVLGDDERRIRVWNKRVETIEAMLDRKKETGRDSYFESIIWGTALGFWLVHRDDEQAAPVLEENLAAYRRILPEDDPWLPQVEGLLACARMSTVTDPTGVADLATRIERGVAAIGRDERGAPLHRLFLERLIALYGADDLDNPERIAEINAILAELNADG